MSHDPLSNNNILRISDKKTLQLIDLYRQQQCLWNTKLPEYKDKIKRAQAAESIAAALDLPNFTAQHVIMKFKNLRNSYSQELKKIAQSLKSGGEEYTPKVFWYPMLDAFIKPHLQPTRGSPYEHMVYQEREEVLLPDTSLGEHSGSEDFGTRKRKSTSKRPSKRAAVAPPAPVIEDEQKSMAQTLCDISAHLRVLMSHNDDYFDRFGKYVAELVRSLPPHRALAIQAQVVQLITDAMSDPSNEDSASEIGIKQENTSNYSHEDD